MKSYCGTPASPGIAIGPARVVRKTAVHVVEHVLAESEVTGEIGRFGAAVAASRAQLEEVARRHLAEGRSELAAILEAHLLIAQDPAILEEVEDRIRSRLRNAEAVVSGVVGEHAATLAALPDAYLAERAADVRDVGDRIIRNLLGLPDPAERLRPADGLAGRPAGAATPEAAGIILAHDLAPSDTAQLDRRQVLAFVTETGGPTSHTAIMARALEIPAVVGTGEFGAEAPEGATVIVDGDRGVVVLQPDEETIAGYRSRQAERAAERQRLAGLRDLPAVTTDGRRVELAANLGHPREAARALEQGAAGVGLYRTEFLFLDRPTLPGEDEQYEAYRAVAEAFGERPVIIRTLDIGGDKEVPALGLPGEANPFLGWRALRISLERQDLFRTQLRALWRAAAHGNVMVMFPMVTTVDEVRLAKAALASAGEELAAEGQARGGKLAVGIMVETPAAATIADILAKEVDFFSLGTNDLTQYTLAVDRGNERVSHLYDPFHPAVLRLVARTLESAHQAGIWCGMCGEMAGDVAAAPFLVGIGVDELSMSPVSIPPVKEAIRGMSAARAAEAARKALNARSGAEARQLLAGL